MKLIKIEANIMEITNWYQSLRKLSMASKIFYLTLKNSNRAQKYILYNKWRISQNPKLTKFFILT